MIDGGLDRGGLEREVARILSACTHRPNHRALPCHACIDRAEALWKTGASSQPPPPDPPPPDPEEAP